MPHNSVDQPLQLENQELIRRIAELEVLVLSKEMIGLTLVDSEKRYRRLFESAQDGILILDAETGIVVDVNPFLVQLLGYSYEELCGKCLWEIGSFVDIAASKSAFKALQSHEYIRYDNLPLRTADGRSIAVEFVSNVYLVDHNKVIQCNVRDVTAQKQSEAERRRLSTAIEQSVECVVITDAQGDIQFVNPAFERATGYSRQEVLGQSPRLLKSDKQDAAFYTYLWETITGGRTWAGQIVNKRKDGTLYTEETTISPILDPFGVIVNYVAVKRDISEHLRLAALYQQSHKMEAVGLLAGGVAHDYNNMLTVILGYAEMAVLKVAANSDDRDDLLEILQQIIRAAQHSAEITRQLLAFARKQTIQPVVLDLNEIVAGTLKLLQRLIGEDIDLSWEPGENLEALKLDPVQINQILANLCINARDAIAGIGHIWIQTSNVILDAQTCGDDLELKPGSHVLLSVRDDGCGMDKAMLGQIFEPFFTSKGVGVGTGLGLSMVYGIVRQNQGAIKVTSEIGVGTTFHIYLPCFHGLTPEVPPPVLDEIPLGSGERVLLVEDEPAILKLGQAMLHRLGYRVLAARSPREALEKAAQPDSTPDLVITDLIMPGMNGKELSARLHAAHPSTRFLFMSVYATANNAGRDLLDDGQAFIQKPFSMRQLAFKVREVLEVSAKA